MNQHRLEIERTFRVPRRAVFEAWTSTTALPLWHCGTVTETIMNLSVDGQFLIRFAPDETGHEACVRGTYLEVVAPERLRYTWKWDGTDSADSVITIEFIEMEEEVTLMRVVHEKLPSEESSAGHSEGWHACFEGLAQYFS